ncbi:M48 family metallopeptidase [Paludibacterium sp. THUN1379]|uniref:M48 family metalloprotease n=1 Tax=Paludibacterium sp. THUN1379 TaxID=3112107 RepID=UPI00308CFA6C|nr:M48 family metallopeptidase [Paludibacterium sp. THUN1379]
MKKHIFTLPMLLVALAATPSHAIDLNGMLSAGMKLASATTLSDDDAKSLSLASIKQEDAKSRIAPANNKYSKRLAKLTRDMQNEDGLKLNYKVYLTKDVNAFCTADGSVRVYSGLMDMMNDDELRFVLGHEIGHAKLGHVRKALQVAYATSAARDAAAATDGTAAQLSQSALGDLAEAVVNAQFSQKEETDADAYGVGFLKKHQYDLHAAVTSMSKIQTISDDHSWLADHPASSDRVANLKKLVGE